jgi:GNAT superfamily N-acetyltransferase
MTRWNIGCLADHLDAIPALAAWFAHEWGDGGRQRSEAAYAALLKAGAGSERLPITLLGFLYDEPVATATLKFREIEYSEEADFWVGWVCVREDMRGRGFGTALVTAAEARAVAMGLTSLYLHTPGKETFYRHLGWRTIGMTIADERRSTVMNKVVGGQDPATR